MSRVGDHRFDVAIRDLWETLKEERVAPHGDGLFDFLMEHEATIRSCEDPVLDVACYNLAYEDGVWTAALDFDKRTVRFVARHKMTVAVSFYEWE